MAFDINIQTTDQKADTSLMEAELSRIGMKLELAKEALATYKDLTDEIETARVELKEIEKERIKGAKIIAENSRELEAVEENKKQAEKDIQDYQNNINQYKKETEELVVENNELYVKKEKAEKELQAVKSELINVKKDLDLTRNSSKEQIEISSREIMKIREELMNLKEEKTALSEALARIEQDIKEKKEILFKHNEDIKNAENSKSVLEAEIIKKSAEMLAETEIHNKKMADDNAVLNKREGDISLRESWLAEKTETLKANKEELEKFFNRKITNINI